MIVYIAGPMRGYPEHNFPAFAVTAAYFRSLGHEVVNPVEICSGILEGSPPTVYLREDLIELVSRCNAITLLPGWEKSVGAKIEAAVARMLGFTFFRSDSALVYTPSGQNIITNGYELPPELPDGKTTN